MKSKGAATLTFATDRTDPLPSCDAVGYAIAMRALSVLFIALAAVPAFAIPPCGGDAIVPTQVIEGSFSSSIQGAYVMVPFDVPPGTTQVRVKYCWDKPETGTASHTIDLGLWDARPPSGDW